MAWLIAAYSLTMLPLAFWWCCCQPTSACSLSCCRNGTAPASGLTGGISGFEFIFTSFPTNTANFCPAGTCEAFYHGVSIILDYEGIPGGLGECIWRGLGGNPYPPAACTELPDVRVYFGECSSDRKSFTFVVSATTYPHIAPESCRITITSTTAGDVVCNAIQSGTLSSIHPTLGGCVYRGAQFTIQAIPA